MSSRKPNSRIFNRLRNFLSLENRQKHQSLYKNASCGPDLPCIKGGYPLKNRGNG